MSNPLISVVIACYNHAQYIVETLKSVEAQSFQDWECIVINDGSTDDSSKTIQTYITNKPKFKLINQENKGVSSARNRAIKNANGKYILPLDADDLLSVNFISSMTQKIESDKNITLVYPEVTLFGKKNKLWKLPPYNYKALLSENMIVITSLFKKTDFEQCGGFDENMHKGSEDWEFLIRLLNGNKLAEKASDAMLFYRIKTQSKNATVLSSKKLLNETFEYICRKNIDIYNQYFTPPLVLYHQLKEYQKPAWKRFAKYILRNVFSKDV